MPPKRLWELLSRKYNNELTPEEQEELEQLLREHRDVFELNETFSRLKDMPVQPLTTPADEERSRQAIAARLPPPPLARSPKKLLRWAAAACAVLIVAGIWFYHLKTTPSPLPGSQNEVATSTSKSKVLLPDGSTVILNRQSKLVYNKDFGVNKREISLTGEAYFDIAKNEAIPLTVVAGPIQIKVMGTAFNVRAYTGDSTIETSLIRGSIEVSSSDDPERSIRMRPNEKIIFGKNNTPSPISPGAKSAQGSKPAQIFVQMNRIQPNPIDSTINEIVWVQDKLVFSKEPFYSLAKKMERWYQVRIRFKDKISEQLSLTGSLEKESLTEALDALRQLTPFNYQIDSGVVTISKNNKPD
ncbi:MAG: FecR domain-containing protein [Chitinophagaceae bacterium]|nr:FecR domain-containing protein [Chitinophagaceae bacterium]